MPAVANKLLNTDGYVAYNGYYILAVKQILVYMNGCGKYWLFYTGG